MGERILVADDEERIRRLLRDYLIREGYEVSEAPDGTAALEQFQDGSFDLVILDVMMPGHDGWTVLRRIRAESNVPVIMLSARGEEDDLLFGYQLGADEYVPKPFSPRVLVARVQAVLRRREPGGHQTRQAEGIVLDPVSHRVFVDGEEIDMRPKEYDLLRFFMENAGVALSRERVLDAVWGHGYYGDFRTVDTHIRRLRDKLGSRREQLQTVRGVGYRFG